MEKLTNCKGNKVEELVDTTTVNVLRKNKLSEHDHSSPYHKHLNQNHKHYEIGLDIGWDCDSQKVTSSNRNFFLDGTYFIVVEEEKSQSTSVAK